MRKRTKIIGRKEEQEILREAYGSKKAEFIAIYGRRRVGKTFLVKNLFEGLKCRFLYVTGMIDGSLREQLHNFDDALKRALMPGLRPSSSWMDAFKLLTETYERLGSNEKFVIFFDELPWLVTKKSRFLQALDYYWNRHWSHDERVKLIVCGSAASWIINNIICNKGGLYNRITGQIRLDPFSLKESQALLAAYGVRLNHRHMMEIYMVTGGIPYYLIQIRKELSAAQNIEKLAFRKQGILYQDFDLLFTSLFDEAEIYIDIIRIISKFRYGIDQDEIFRQCKSLSKGGGAVRKLQDLEEAGFIISFLPYGHKRKGVYYRLIDEYVNFYLKWVDPIKNSSQKLSRVSWMKFRESPSWKSWAGYTYETICLKHVEQIRIALKLEEGAMVGTWKHIGKGDEKGTQIDLLFDRMDDSVTVCEIKYTDKPFTIDREYYHALKNKIDVYTKVTKTKKQIFLAIISASGLKPSLYSEEYVSSVVTLEQLFK